MTRRNRRPAIQGADTLEDLEAELQGRRPGPDTRTGLSDRNGVTTPTMAARWMLGRLQQRGRLYQAEAARESAGRFGDEFTFTTPDGRLALDGSVLRAFKKITGDSVVWEHGEFCWRWREAGDGPGRSQGRHSDRAHLDRTPFLGNTRQT